MAGETGRVGEEGEPMAWSLNGTYFENCSCDTICPCTWSGLTAHATHDRCKALLAFHIDRGDIEGVDVSGLTFAMVIDSPPVMSDGGWSVGVLVDERADDAQREKLGALLSGQLGGPPAMLGPLIGDMRGVDFVPTEYTSSGEHHHVRFGDVVDVEVDDVRVPDLPGPVTLNNVFHPANTTLTVGKASRSRVAAFGIEFDGTGTSGFSAPYSWAA
jgi:hypothetical protein